MTAAQGTRVMEKHSPGSGSTAGASSAWCQRSFLRLPAQLSPAERGGERSGAPGVRTMHKEARRHGRPRGLQLVKKFELAEHAQVGQ